MTMSVRRVPELADTSCSVADCLEMADVMGRATVRTDPRTEAPPDFEVITFGLPLCTTHAHLLRLGCTLSEFDSGR
jgi:hypothetical protein